MVGGGGGGSGSMGGGGGNSSYSYSVSLDEFDARILLLDNNCGIGGVEGGQPWICLGVIRALHPTKNVWLQRR